MVNAEQLKDFEKRLEAYIETKDNLERDDLRDGQRGFITPQRIVNPIAFGQAIAANVKNSNPKKALYERHKNLVHAEYLLKIVQSIRSGKNKNTEDFDNEIYRQVHYGKLDQNSTYFENILLPESRKINATKMDDVTDIEKLWPYFLYSKVPDECSEKADYSISNFNTIIIRENISFDKNNIDDCFEKIFNQMNIACDYNYIGYDPLMPSAHHSQSSQADTDLLIQSRNDKKIPEAGIGLSSIVAASDGLMHMELDPNRFAAWTLTGFDNDQPIGFKETALQNGWYQYVIMAEPKNQFRYFPCSPTNGGHIPYKKYISHSEISGSQEIYAAGAFEVKNGKIIKIDNSSGHYPTSENNVDYAKQVLQHLGFKNIDSVQSIIMREMNLRQNFRKQVKKLKATTYGMFAPSSSSIDQEHTRAAAAERRPIPPTHLQGHHLYNLQAEHRKLFYQQAAKNLGYKTSNNIAAQSDNHSLIAPDITLITPPSFDSCHTEEEWLHPILAALSRDKDCNHYMIEINDFPADKYQYYLTLQKKIAKIIPDEHLRPNICLRIQGKAAKNKMAFTGLIGGSGPVSDAMILKGLLEKNKDIDQTNAVLFSFPPPRYSVDTRLRFMQHGARYNSLLATYTGKYPAQYNFLLSNTAHANIREANILVSSGTGSIVHMVNQVVQDTVDNNSKDVHIVVLGTTQAANAQLYKNAFNAKGINHVHLPNLDQQERLQNIITAVKNEKATHETKQAFLDLLKEIMNTFPQDKPPTRILLACTELPLLISDKELDDFYRKQAKEFNDIKTIDTEKAFIEYIQQYHQLAKANAELQARFNNSHLIHMAMIALASPPAMIAGGFGTLFGAMLVGHLVTGCSIQNAYEHSGDFVKDVAHYVWDRAAEHTAAFVLIGLVIAVGLYFTAKAQMTKAARISETVDRDSKVIFSNNHSRQPSEIISQNQRLSTAAAGVGTGSVH